MPVPLNHSCRSRYSSFNSKITHYLLYVDNPGHLLTPGSKCVFCPWPLWNHGLPHSRSWREKQSSELKHRMAANACYQNQALINNDFFFFKSHVSQPVIIWLHPNQSPISHPHNDRRAEMTIRGVWHRHNSSEVLPAGSNSKRDFCIIQSARSMTF